VGLSRSCGAIGCINGIGAISSSDGAIDDGGKQGLVVAVGELELVCLQHHPVEQRDTHWVDEDHEYGVEEASAVVGGGAGDAHVDGEVPVLGGGVLTVSII
jgi:hypothetical protein